MGQPNTIRAAITSALTSIAEQSPVRRPISPEERKEELKRDFVPGGILASSVTATPFAVSGVFRDNGIRFSGLERRIANLESSVPNLEGEELLDALKTLRHFQSIERDLFDLSHMKINNPTVEALRRDCAGRLMADVGNPSAAKDYQEGQRLLEGLRTYAAKERSFFSTRDTIASHYPGDRNSAYVFVLDADEAVKAETDPTWKTDRPTFRNIPFVKQYENWTEHGSPERKEAAGQVKDLLAALRDVKDFEIKPEDLEADPVKALEAANAVMTRTMAFVKPGVQEFLKSFQEDRNQSLSSGSPEERAARNASESMQAFALYPVLIKNLSDPKVLASRTPEELRGLLLDVTKDLSHWSGRLEAGLNSETVEDANETPEEMTGEDPDFEQPFETTDSVTERHPCSDALEELSGKLEDLKGEGLKTESLAAVAAEMAKIAKVLQAGEPIYLKGVLNQKLEKLKGCFNDEGMKNAVTVEVWNLFVATQEKVNALAPDSPPEAYIQAAVAVDRMHLVGETTLRLIAGSILIRARVSSDYSGRNIAGWTAPGSNIGGTPPEDMPYMKPYYDLKKAYIDVYRSLLSDDVQSVAKARQDLDRLNHSGQWPILDQEARDAIGVNAAYATILLNGCFLGLGEVTAGLTPVVRTLTGFLPIGIGAQRLVALGLTYVGLGGVLTGINREVRGILNPHGEQGNFFLEWLTTTGMLVAGAGGGRGGQSVFNKGLDWMAKRNIAARTGTALAVAGRETAISQSVLAAERAQIMEGLTARFARQASVFGAEFPAIQAYNYVSRVGTLVLQGDEDPFGKAWDEVTSWESQAHLAGFLVVMKAMDRAAGGVRPEVEAAYTNAELKALSASRNRESAKLEEDVEAAMKQGGFEDDSALLRTRPDLVKRAQGILSMRIDELAIRANRVKADPTARVDSDAFLGEELNFWVRQQFRLGMSSIFSEGNAFGVKPAWEGAKLDYAYSGQPGKIVAALRGIRGVDPSNITIHGNGMIDVRFAPSELFPQGQAVRIARAGSAH